MEKKHHNMSEEKKQKLKEYQKKISKKISTGQKSLNKIAF